MEFTSFMVGASELSHVQLAVEVSSKKKSSAVSGLEPGHETRGAPAGVKDHWVASEDNAPGVVETQ